VRTRPLGQTGISVTELTLGTWGLSGEGYGFVASEERDRVIDKAVEVGITTFETADVYGHGAMESCLGQRLLLAPSQIITRVGTFRPEVAAGAEEHAHKRFDPQYLRDAVKRSQERLRRPKIDVVLLHNPSASTVSRGEAAGVMKELKKSGVIGAWGVSAGDSYVARAAIGQGAEVIELAYNVFFSRELHELAGELRTAGVGILARSVLSYGLLAGLYAGSHYFPSGDHRGERWSRQEFETRIRQLEAVRALMTGPVFTMRGAAVRFVLANEMVSSAVLGPKDVSQLQQLVGEAGTEPPYLTDESLTQLAAELTRVGVVT
jgi:aryl-alcohol dehydrogenase-like predicted oxidoreductase